MSRNTPGNSSGIGVYTFPTMHESDDDESVEIEVTTLPPPQQQPFHPFGNNPGQPPDMPTEQPSQPSLYHNNHNKQQQQQQSRSLDASNNNSTGPVDYQNRYTGPVDLDALFEEDYVDDDSLFSDEQDDRFRRQQSRRGRTQSFHEEPEDIYDEYDAGVGGYYNNTYFSNPNRRLLDNDASLIPGSPFSKPPNRTSNRPNEPLVSAKYASTLASMLTVAWIVYLIFAAIWNYTTPGRIVVEVLLSLLAFFGIFWNCYFIVSSIFKCFIPAKAFRSNTKYCSIIPEVKHPAAEWLDVTIQIPVYKESLRQVLMPTLHSCIAARDYYRKLAIQNNQYTNGAGPAPGAAPGGQHQSSSSPSSSSSDSNSMVRCNIVVCDDGMMAFLRDNFPAAEMLWKNILETQGRVIKLSKLLKRVPRASRRHLKGLRSQSVYEVFHRMLFYYHFDIGFVARSTIDRRGKFKKASNLNSHLRLALGAAQMVKKSEQDGGGGGGAGAASNAALTFEEALLAESHNEDGSRYVMFGNDIHLGHLICINDADARMAESVIYKTVPEFLNDRTLGFTQHATKTMTDQRGESYFINLLAVYTDALYQGHFLLSSILGCHPPLVGHSIFLRTEAVKQCGRMRTLRKAQRWLRNIGLPFLPVDQIGFSNLQAENRTEYWSENHVSEDFELMIHLYNLGFNGRYCAYPDCEFEEGITRTFDEEAGRHRKFSLGAHELVFNPFQDMLGHGIFSPLFKTFLSCDIPSYYKVFLAAYLCSYASGGSYLIVFLASCIAKCVDATQIKSLYMFSPASVIILNFVIYYVLGYITFLISLIRMNSINNKLLFPEYRKRWCGSLYLIFVKIRYCLVFQFLFYNVASLTFYFLGSMDHLLSRPGVVSATNKDTITISRCTAFWDMVKFNLGSFAIALIVAGAAYATVLVDPTVDWDVTVFPWETWLEHALFAGPALLLAALCFIVPIILNPYILGWPFLCRPRKNKTKKQQQQQQSVSGSKSSGGTARKKSGCMGGGGKKVPKQKDALGRDVVDIKTFMNNAEELQEEIERVQGKPDVELGSLSTRDLRSHVSNNNMTKQQQVSKIFLEGTSKSEKKKQQQQQQQKQQQQQQQKQQEKTPSTDQQKYLQQLQQKQQLQQQQLQQIQQQQQQNAKTKNNNKNGLVEQDGVLYSIPEFFSETKFQSEQRNQQQQQQLDANGFPITVMTVSGKAGYQQVPVAAGTQKRSNYPREAFDV